MIAAEATESIIEQRKGRWRELYDPASGRKAVFTLHFNDPDAPAPPGVPPYPEHKAARIEAALGNYAILYDRAGWLDDDTIPFLDVHTGTEIFAEAFGCGVYRHEGAMPSARPLITQARQVAGLKAPKVFDSPLARLFEIGDELRRRAGREAVVKIPDIQSPMGIAALIWDKTRFYVAVHDDPQAVEDLAAMCRQLLTAFCDAWLERYGRDFISHYPVYYMPGGLTLSEDEIGAVSPEMFRRFFLPHLAALSRRFGGLGMHCCAAARHQWANLKMIPNLRALNLTRGAQEVAEAYAYFAGHCVQIHDGMPAETPPEWYSRNAPGARVVIRTWAEDKAGALRASDRLRRFCERKQT